MNGDITGLVLLVIVTVILGVRLGARYVRAEQEQTRIEELCDRLEKESRHGR